MSDLGIKVTAAMLNLDSVQGMLKNLSSGQIKQACSLALNDTGFAVRRAWQEEMRGRFDRVTPYMEKSPTVKRSTPDNLTVTIEPRANLGKEGVEPQKILQAQAFGGGRRDKKSEVMLRRAGILPNGWQTAIPATPFPGSDDGRGNLRGPFMVQLLSYLQTFASSGRGFEANMSDKRKKSIHKGTAKREGRRYFVTYGAARGGARRTARGDFDERASNLPPGIWAATGTGGVNVRPVVMFVKPGRYTPRLDVERVAQEADVQNTLDRRVRYRIRQIAGE